MYRRILLLVDVRRLEEAKRSFASIVAWLNASGGVVHFLNLVRPFPTVALADFVLKDFDNIEMRSKEEAKNALALLAKSTGLASSRVTTAVRVGNILAVIDQAKTINADLIFVCSSTRPMQTWDSTSDNVYLIRNAPCPVLISTATDKDLSGLRLKGWAHYLSNVWTKKSGSRIEHVRLI